MKNEPLISVIIPCFNRELTIIESIYSVLNQTYKNIELIIVDDCSTDKTESLIRSIKDKRIIYFRQPYNQGACAARNEGIRLAKGDYVAFQDSDDKWMRQKLEKQLNFILHSNADLVYCAMLRIDGRKKLIIPEKQKEYDVQTLEVLLAGNKISTQTMFMKKKVVDDIKFDVSFKRLQDWDYALRVVAKGYKVQFQNSVLVESFVQKDSITRTISSENAYLHLIDKHKAEYEKYPQARARVYSIIAYRLRGVDKKKSLEYLKLSYHYDKRFITFLKIKLSKLRIW